MMIHVKQNIEPIPVKEYGDLLADKKYRKTKKPGKTTEEDMYNFYGDYDLTPYLEDPATAGEQSM